MKILKANIIQVYVQNYVSHAENDRPIEAFRVMAQVKNQPDTLIERGLVSYSDARILEQWLEQKLGLQDRAVPGEVAV